MKSTVQEGRKLLRRAKERVEKKHLSQSRLSGGNGRCNSRGHPAARSTSYLPEFYRGIWHSMQGRQRWFRREIAGRWMPQLGWCNPHHLLSVPTRGPCSFSRAARSRQCGMDTPVLAWQRHHILSFSRRSRAEGYTFLVKAQSLHFPRGYISPQLQFTHRSYHKTRVTSLLKQWDSKQAL